MRIKFLFVLVGLFLLQFFTSCCRDSPLSYQVEYHGMSITPWNTSGFNPTVASDTLFRNTFGLSVQMEFEPEEVSYNLPSFGFSHSFAFQCPDDEFQYVDPVDYAEIFLTNLETQEQYEVTALFRMYGFDGEWVSVDEFFETHGDAYDGFQFELYEFEAIPSAVIFTVNVYLQSGVQFSENTQQINFFD